MPTYSYCISWISLFLAFIRDDLIKSMNINVMINIFTFLVVLLNYISVTRLMTGQNEIQVFTMLNDAKKHYMDIIEIQTQYRAFSSVEAIKLRNLEVASLECVLDALNMGCGLYLENKVNRSSFKHIYSAEIKNSIYLYQSAIRVWEKSKFIRILKEQFPSLIAVFEHWKFDIEEICSFHLSSRT